ncbi:MAG: signal peptidase II [Deltaproteobacteria bacterium]|jgi:signal peptidase II|nr:signal peptidase II [Deltaproteobacteria bacterium]
MAKRYRLPLTLAALIVGLDQCTKMAVESHLPLNHGIPVIKGFFNLVRVHNRGAAFGFLNRPDITWQFWIFSGFALFALILVLLMLRWTRHPGLTAKIAFGAILGGALGNFIDRLRLRYVIDFLDFHLGQWHWPAFNVADIAICTGVLLFALITLFPRRWN